MTSGEDVIKEAVRILKERYGAKLPDLIDAYEDTVGIPAPLFASSRTPLETAALYLSEEKSLSGVEIARLLNRGPGAIANALKNARKKAEPLTIVETPYRVPVDAFRKELTPAEAVVHALAQRYGLPNATVADLIGRDPRNTWKLLDNARKKLARGDAQ